VVAVLVIDDDADIRDIVSLRLGVSGYEVREAENGASGLESARGQLPDLILLDIQMPQLNGIDTCKAIREDVLLARIPVILLTAKGHESDVDRGFDAGADDYMVKPFSLVELESRIRRYLGRFDAAGG